MSPSPKRTTRKRIWLCIGVAAFLICLAGMIGISCIVRSPEEAWPGEALDSSVHVEFEGTTYEYRDEIVNILCVGVDKPDSLEDVSESIAGGFADAVFLLSVNTETKDWRVTVIPRDTITDIIRTDVDGNEIDTQKLQITYQYVTGKSPEQSGALMKRTVSELLYGIPIHRICTLNLEAVPIMNDMVGGVDVTVIEDLTWGIPHFVLGETIHLEGEDALAYVKTRNIEIPGSNLLRIERQKQYIAAFFEKAKQAIVEDASLVLKIYKELERNLYTDLSQAEIMYLAGLVKDLSFDDTKLCQIPGEQVAGEYFEEFYPDEEALKQLLLETFFETGAVRTEVSDQEMKVLSWDVIPLEEPESVAETEEPETVVEPELMGQPETTVESEAIEEPYPNDIDFESLQALNPDIYGWIRIPGTNIDYPLLSHEEDGYYLDYLYDGQKGNAGAIFTDKYNSRDMTDPVTVIYGHNMNKSGTMFSELHKFEDETFWQEYSDVYIYLPGETLKYQIFLAASAKDSYLLSAYDFSKGDELQRYLADLDAGEIKVSDDSIAVTEGEQMIVLSTCFAQYPELRWLVNAKLIDRKCLQE